MMYGIAEFAFKEKLWENGLMGEKKAALSVVEIQKRLNPLFRDARLQLVLLFGSSVHGKIHKQSDIDLAFLFDEGPVDILALTNEVIRLLHTDSVDLVALRRATPLLRFSIMKNGVPLYERTPGIYNCYYSLAFRMYVDTKKLREAQADAIKYFLKERGLV